VRALVFLVPLLALACESDPSKDDKPPSEICDNLEDDDLDDLADCADPDCAAVCGEVCTNGTDDDLDGLIDCLDDDCDGLCPENCGDGRDNDADGAIDCDDRDCFGSCPEVCGDGFDNDGDGKVDCLDEECVDPSCAEVCTDGRDNDADGLIDCLDDDCNDPSCDENCVDGRDNDGDGRVDCDDSDCDGDCPEVCDDGRDNDADGRVDCDDPECEAECDADGDGFFNEDFGGDDCDDTRADVNPSRPEICNGDEVLDDDCDGLFDENDPDVDVFTLIAWGPDNDGDGFGTDRDIQFACQQPDGWGFANMDCDDSRADVNPDMPEICNPEGPLDDDCDGLVDDADPDVTEDSYLEWYADRDRDGFGADDDFVYACSRPDGTSASNDDCDDADPTVGPPSLWFPDVDSDGFGAGDPVDPTPTCDAPGPGLRPEWVGLDCDDSAPLTYPGAEEICEDGIDQDCDGEDRSCIQMYIADGRRMGGNLYAVDLRAGTVAPVAVLPGSITGLSYSPDGELFAVGSEGFGSDGQVYRVDLIDFSFTPVHRSDFYSWSGFSWNYADERLYMWTEEGDAMYEVDLATGSERYVYSAGSAGHCMASDASGQMYRLSGNTLYEIDHVAGREVSLGVPAGLPYGFQGQGCAFLDGLLYVAPYTGAGDRELYEIDVAARTAHATGILFSINIDAIGAFEP
jgi:hypothetical protein